MKIKRIIDISRKISPDVTVWQGDRKVQIKREFSLEKNEYCNYSSIHMGLHTGTHGDAPFHFIREGRDVLGLDLMKFIGPVKVFEISPDRKNIGLRDIDSLEINEGDAVFFKTSNSHISDEQPFFKDYVYIGEDAARYLAGKKVRTVGIDYLSVDGYGMEDFPVHMILLSEEIGIIEGLNLKEAATGEYFFSALPLKIEGVEGSPVRAVLLEV